MKETIVILCTVLVLESAFLYRIIKENKSLSQQQENTEVDLYRCRADLVHYQLHDITNIVTGDIQDIPDNLVGSVCRENTTIKD
jgi:hypothetical protein